MDFDPQEDIRADIEAAMKGTEAPPASQVEPTAEIPQPTEAKLEDAPDDGRARDEQGRFAKAPEQAQAQEVPPPQASQEPPQETIRPPASWSATAKAKFAALDPDVQREVLKREGDIENGKAQWDSKGERLNKFEALFAPHRDRLQLAQTDEFRYIQGLITADEMLRGPNAHQALSQIAAMYGLNLGQAATAPQQMQAQPAVPATFSPDAVNQQISQAVEAALAKQREESLGAEAFSTWQAFRNDPKNPYAENVKEDMAALLEKGRASDYADAYEKACWANPEVRALLIAAQAKPSETPRDVKPAGLSVVGGRGLGQPAQSQSNPNSTVEDDVREAMKALAGRI